MKTIIFYCEKMAVGGTETLLLRLMKWYLEKGARTILLNETFTQDERLIADIRLLNTLEYYRYDKAAKKFLNCHNEELKLPPNEKIYVNAQYFPEFFRCVTLLFSLKYKSTFIFSVFIVHPQSTNISRVIAFLCGRKMVNSLITSGNLFFMDEETKNTCAHFYHLSNRMVGEMKILRLPIFVNDDISTIDSSHLNVLSISRFEFPFKGYILGLIDDFSKLDFKKKDANLLIIGYGKGYDIVMERINNLPSEVRRRIELKDKVPYFELGNYIKESNVYVGMGTTVLDAANYNRICIIACPYQMGNYSNGFFHEKCFDIGTLYNNKIKYDTFFDLLSTVAAYDPQRFVESSLQNKKMLIQNYDINKIAPYFISAQLKEFSPSLNRLVFFASYLFNMHRILFILVKSFSSLFKVL